MAFVRNGLYIPEEKDLSAIGSFTPDSNVSGQRFVPDGNGGGTLFIRRRRMVKGFRTPQEDWIEVRKTAFNGKPNEHT